MKKKILAITLAVAMLSASGAVFADELLISPTPSTSTEQIVDAPVEKQYIATKFTVNSATKDDKNRTFVDCTDENDGPANLTLDETTPIFDNTGKALSASDIKEGTKVTMYYYYMQPTLMIYPPQYTPNVLVVETEEVGFVDTDAYSAELINSDYTLALNISEETVIERVNGDKATAEDVKGAHVAVFYTATTRSVPAQTTPSKIVILDTQVVPSTESIEDQTKMADVEKTDYDSIPATEDGEIATIEGSGDTVLDDAMMVTPAEQATLTVDGKLVDVDFVTMNGTLMLPVRPVAEAMGLEVKWNDERKAVNVGTDAMGVFFAVGADEYSKARAVPAILGQAPVLVKIDDTTDFTYVPVNFFTDILEANLSETENGSITLTTPVVADDAE